MNLISNSNPIFLFFLSMSFSPVSLSLLLSLIKISNVVLPYKEMINHKKGTILFWISLNVFFQWSFFERFLHVCCSQVIDTVCISKDPLWLDDRPTAFITCTQINAHVPRKFPISLCCLWGVQSRGRKDVRHSIRSWEFSGTCAWMLVVKPNTHSQSVQR